MHGSAAWRSVGRIASHQMLAVSISGCYALRSRQRESSRSTSERRAGLTTLPTKRQQVIWGLEIPLPLWRKGSLLETPQHMRHAEPVGSRAVDRFSSVVERLAHEFEQVYARLRWACAACWDREEHIDDVLALLTLLFGLWLERCASPWRERLWFRRARRHAEELHVLRQGVAELACDGVEFFAVGENFHVVVDEV